MSSLKITTGFTIDASILHKYGDVPLDIFGLFHNSVVKLDPKKDDNAYTVRGNTPSISTSSGGDIPLLHEIGHFVLAPVERLHLSNYGFKFPYHSENHWHDLASEIQVLAIERNLLDHYRVQKDDDSDVEAAQVWDFLDGWDNYQSAHKLNGNQMKARMGRKLVKYRKKYPAYWVLREWEARNKLLRARLKARKSIVPARPTFTKISDAF